MFLVVLLLVSFVFLASRKKFPKVHEMLGEPLLFAILQLADVATTYYGIKSHRVAEASPWLAMLLGKFSLQIMLVMRLAISAVIYVIMRRKRAEMAGTVNVFYSGLLINNIYVLLAVGLI